MEFVNNNTLRYYDNYNAYLKRLFFILSFILMYVYFLQDILIEVSHKSLRIINNTEIK
jgi:hypothetical protein